MQKKHACKHTHPPQFLHSLWKGLTLEMSVLKLFTVANLRYQPGR